MNALTMAKVSVAKRTFTKPRAKRISTTCSFRVSSCRAEDHPSKPHLFHDRQEATVMNAYAA